jgi:hypothetical protein
MLKALKEFRISLTESQIRAFEKTVPGGLVEKFNAANDEPSSKEVIEGLRAHFGHHPLDAYKLFKKLNKEQKSLISRFLED